MATASSTTQEIRARLRELVLTSRCVVNISDPSELVLINEKTGQIYRGISPGAIRTALTKSEYYRFEEEHRAVCRFEYAPRRMELIGQDPTGALAIYNTFVPPEWKRRLFFFGEPVAPLYELPEIYDKFFAHLTAHDAASKEYLLDWLANSLQSRNYTFLVAIGEQGIGKGTLGEIMSGLHGIENFYRGRDEVFKNRFNSQLANKTLFYADEVYLDTKTSEDRIKDVVNERLEIERKGHDPVIVENYASFYLSSNSHDAIQVEAGDRRFSIIQLTDKKLIEVPEVFKHISDFTKPENIALLARYLYFREMKSPMNAPFVNSTRYLEVREAGLKDWEYYVLYTWAPGNPGRTASYKELQDVLDGTKRFRGIPGRNRFQSLARRYPEVLKVTTASKGDWIIQSVCKPKPMTPRLKKVIANPEGEGEAHE